MYKATKPLPTIVNIDSPLLSYLFKADKVDYLLKLLTQPRYRNTIVAWPSSTLYYSAKSR